MVDLICIVCPNGCHLKAEIKDGKLAVTGNKCRRGEAFAEGELTAPKRTLTSTVRTAFKELPFVPVRTDGEIPKQKIQEVMALLKNLKAERLYSSGEAIVKNALDTGVDIIVTLDMKIATEEILWKS